MRRSICGLPPSLSAVNNVTVPKRLLDRVPHGERGKPVKGCRAAVKKPSTNRFCRSGGPSFGVGPRQVRTAAPAEHGGACDFDANGADMSVLVFITLTVAVFALLGLVQRLVERL